MELALNEPIVNIIVDSHNKCLILRSGSGHLWALGSLVGLFLDPQQQFHPQRNTSLKKARKIRIPNKYFFIVNV